MPSRESGSLEVTCPHEFIVRGWFTHGLQRGGAVGAYLALFSLFRVELGIWWELGREEQSKNPLPPVTLQGENGPVSPFPWELSPLTLEFNPCFKKPVQLWLL